MAEHALNNGINGAVFTRRNARFGIGYPLRNQGPSGSIVELVDITPKFEYVFHSEHYWKGANGKKIWLPAFWSMSGPIKVRSLGRVKFKGEFIPRKNTSKVKVVNSSWYTPVKFASKEAEEYVNKILGRSSIDTCNTSRTD